MSSESIDHFSELILVAGVSGAGKSSALDTLSDLGFYVIDNLPVALFSEFISFSRNNPDRFKRTAVLLEIDSKEMVAGFLEILEHLDSESGRRELMFLDCSSETIVNRYNETRRPHPAFDAHVDKTLIEAIQRERSMLFPIKERANLVLETSDLNIHELKREVKAFVDSLSHDPNRTVRVNFLSFGFKYGMPIDCDLVIDVRFLPNPYFIDNLREKTGSEQEVADYVLNHKQATEFLQKYSDLLDFLLPHYLFEGKSYLNIGVGCTGGRHRSVVIANELFKRVSAEDYITSVTHRDSSKYTNLQRE